MAIGAGTDVAVEAAHYVLMRNDLHDVVTALHLSSAALRRIRVNYAWAMVYNLCALPIAAGALYPRYRLQLPPWLAVRLSRAHATCFPARTLNCACAGGCSDSASRIPVCFLSVCLSAFSPQGAAMAFSSVSVVCSSLALRAYKPPPRAPTRRRNRAAAGALRAVRVVAAAVAAAADAPALATAKQAQQSAVARHARTE
jgi:hypothetical protein